MVFVQHIVHNIFEIHLKRCMKTRIRKLKRSKVHVEISRKIHIQALCSNRTDIYIYIFQPTYEMSVNYLNRTVTQFTFHMVSGTHSHTLIRNAKMEMKKMMMEMSKSYGMQDPFSLRVYVFACVHEREFSEFSKV